MGFARQRFDLFQTRNPEVAGAIADPQIMIAAGIGTLDAFVIDFDFFVGFKIVPNQHFLFGPDQCASYLYRREPVDVEVGNYFVRKVNCDESDVFDSADMLFAGRDNRFGLSCNQIVHDGKVVRRQVPDHIGIMLEQAEIDACGIVIVKGAQ